jgi:hypothetical protein
VTTLPAPFGFRADLAGLGILLAALAFFLGMTGSNWRYTPLGGMDNWSYVGYAKHYADPEYRAGLYKSCRLPWIWWQYTVRNLFPGEAGSRALCYSLLLAWAGGWYLFARQFAGPVLAAFLGIFAFFYTPSHGPGGWDYHNTAAGIFLVLAMAMSARIGRRGFFSLLDGFLLGVFLALALHTNITLLNVLPFLAFLFWPALLPVRLPGLLKAAGWILAGGILATFVLGAVNVSVGRRPFFYWKMVETVLHFVGDSSQQAPWYQPLGAAWMGQAHYLAFPVAALGLALVYCVLGGGGASRRLCLFHISLCGAWLGWHLLGQTALNIDYFAYPLTLSALPMLLVAVLPREHELSCLRVTLAAAFGIFVLALGGWLPPFSAPWPLLIQISAFLVGLLLIWKGGKIGWVVGLVALALANGMTPQAVLYAKQAKGTDLRQAHAAILELQDWAWLLRNELPRPPRPSLATVLSGRSFQTDPLAHLIWNPDPKNPTFGAFVGSLGSTDFEMSFPEDRRRAIGNGLAMAEDFQKITPGMVLFVAEENKDGYTRSVKENLRRLGIPFRDGPAREMRLDWGIVRLERIVFL